jgi:hypothetical protein
MAVIHYRDPTTGDWIPLPSQGPPGPPGPPGPSSVEVSNTEPASLDIQVWVDPDGFLGDSGWDGFDARYINADGDIMTGQLTMSNAPLSMSGDVINMNTQKIVNLGNATASTDAMNMTASDARYLKLAGGTLTGPLSMNTQKITNLGTPTATTDAVTKTYVDTLPSKATVSATAPSSPVVGQLWAQP